MAADLLGRVSLQPLHVTIRLPEDERDAIRALELHLWLRGRGPNPAFEILDDGTPAIFLTTSRVQKLLKLSAARRTGRDYARHLTRDILPRFDLLNDTGLVKKPGGGGRKHQPRGLRSYWWPVYSIPKLSKLFTTFSQKLGAYPSKPGLPGFLRLAPREASLFRLLSCQGLVGARPRRRGFASGSVQAAFQATGPP